MDIEYVTLDSTEIEEFRKSLRGKVFHVTSARNLFSIIESGVIRANSDGSLNSFFGNSANGYFRKLGCVSVFDYESPTDVEMEQFSSRCCPLAIRRGETSLAFFYMSDQAKESLIRWCDVRNKWNSERVVPYVEAGHKGDIPLKNVQNVKVIELLEDKDSIAYRLAKARLNRA